MEETIPEETYMDGEVFASGRSEMQEMNDTLRILTKLELDTAYTSEKLVNLHVLLMHLLAWDSDLEGMTITDSAASIEKTLTFDLLCGILESELKAVDEFLDVLEAQVIDTSYKISSCEQTKEFYVIMGGKLEDSAESLKQSRGQLSEITLQLAQLQKTLHYIKNGGGENDESMELSRNSQLKDVSGKLRKPSYLRQKHVLRMLEKSLARELELEKKVSEFRQNEEQLKLKLHYTGQVASRMEEASEVIWGRFLEAENSSEVLTGISKELVGKLQILQFNLNGSVQRESELKSKLEDCITELKAKDFHLQKLEESNAENANVVSEVISLREKVKSAENKLKNTEIELKNVSSSKQELLLQLAEMENATESLKESLFEAESRAESGETKIKELTDANQELTEEINFLKDADDKKRKKVTSLEKQLRELEVNLQNSKALSEASQEQQNMLYSAIWDMETLIEELKSKVSKAETQTETVEEQCIELSTTNFELNKEVNLLRERVNSLEGLLEKTKDEKERSAKEINLRKKLLMDMVMQLATERERIQEQMNSLTKENELLIINLRKFGRKYEGNESYTGDGNDFTTEAIAKSLQAGG